MNASIMAQRWMLALILIYLTTLITAFRVRDLPKSSHDSAKRQENCENCDVKFGNKWHSGIDSVTNEESKKDLREKQTSYLNKAAVKSSNNEENYDDDNEDFSFLKFNADFIQEYPKEALNKLEEKLEIISKSFWNLFGDDGPDVEIDEDKDKDLDVGDDSDDSDDDDHESEPLKISSLLRKSKVFEQKKKTEINTNNIKHEPFKRPALSSKVNYDTGSDNKIKTRSHDESKLKFIELKHKTEVPKHSAHGHKFQSSYISEEDDNEYSSKKISDMEIEHKYKDTKKKRSNVLEQSSKNTFLREKTHVNSQLRENNDEKVLNKITENLSKRYKTNIELTLKDSNKNLPKYEKSGINDYNYGENDSKNDNSSEYDDDEKQYDEYSDEENDNDNIKESNFATKKTNDLKRTLKYKDIIKDNNLLVKQLSKETKDKETLRLIPIQDDKHYEDDLTKNRTKFISKTQPIKILTHEKSSNVVDLTSKPIVEKQRDEDFIKLHKNREHKNIHETQKESRKLDAINKDNINNKTDKQDKDRTGLKNDHTISPTSHRQQSLRKDATKQDLKDERKLKKDTTKLSKKIDNHDEIKSIRDDKDKIQKDFKIIKGSEITKQKTKEFEIEGDLKKLTNKATDDKQKHQVSEEQFADSQEGYSKVESNLKHITEALHRRSLHKSEFEDFYTFLPTFAPNFSRVHNPECRRHGQIMLRQLRGTKLWALNMLDATAKIPSGLLQGNGIQLGDFEQCLGSRARVQLDTGSVVKVQGKYCLAWFDVKAEHSELVTPVHLVQAKNLIKSRVDDPGHFVPRFSTLSWGICVPSPCEPEDVEVILRDAIRHYQRTTGVVVRIKVNEQDCQIEKGADRWERWLELPTVLTLSFYGVIILLVCVATIQDYVSRRMVEETSKMDEATDNAECDYKETKTKEEKTKDLLSIFSLYNTMNKLTAPGSNDDISCIHGVRAIATIALLVAHKFLPVAVMPYTNRLKITEMVSSALWSWCRAGWIFTDCFLLLSGTLSAYRICTSDSGAPKRLLFRYLRLTPALMAVVLFYAYIWDNVSAGPMWGTFVTKNAQVCQEGWWWNLLYLQNYLGFEMMCAPQTHQLALDMQLTILGCIIVWLMQEMGGFTKWAMPAIHILAAYSRYTTVRDHRLTLLAYHGVSVSQLYRTARLSYTSVLHRSTPYLIGITLGIALRKPSKHGKFFLTVGWILSGILWSLVWWAGFDSGSTHYRYNVTSAAQYAAFTPIASAVPIAWVIYAVHNGCSDVLSRLFSSRPLVLISRLSYAIYLCQFIIFITIIGTVKTSSKFTVTTVFDVQELSAIFLLSTIITLTLVIPMQSLPQFLFPSKIEITDEKTQKVDSKIKNKPHKDQKNILKEKEIKPIQKILVHREVLSEIPEVEIEYEVQRDRSDSLDGILEEEENEEDIGEEEYQNHLDDDLVIIEEHGDEESWSDRENESRSRSREEENDLDEWEWTANGRNGAQYLRYTR